MSDTVDWEALRVMAEAGLTPEQIRALNPNDALSQAYGWAAALADIPELQAILDRAVAESWTPDLILAAIQNSEWAKSKRQAQIDYEINRRLHPADTAAEREQLEIYIQQEATKAGIQLSQERIDTMSGWALKHGYSQIEIDAMIKAEFRYDPTKTYGIAQGEAATNLDQLRAIAGAYMVPVSEQALIDWVNVIGQGKDTIATFENWVKNTAKGMFPVFAGQIDAGMDVRTLLSPYQQIAQRELGVFSIDMADPKYLSGLMLNDDKTGVRSLATMDQWLKYLRTNPSLGWDKTVGSHDMVAGLGVALAEEMGARR